MSFATVSLPKRNKRYTDLKHKIYIFEYVKDELLRDYYKTNINCSEPGMESFIDTYKHRY